MNDDRLHDVLATLPRDAASDGFTAATMQRLRDRRARRRRMPLVAAASVVFALTAGALTVRQVSEIREERRLAALRAEQRAIAAELEELKALTDDQQAIVYVGGDENVDVVLDLSKPEAETNVKTVSWE